MARKSINELIAQAAVDFPDNTAGLITPVKLRQFLNDFLEAISPAYGYLLINGSPILRVFGTVPSVVAYQVSFDGVPSQTTSNAAGGTIARSERGTSTLQFTTDFETSNGRFVTFTIYKNGVATSWRITGNGGGAGNPVAVALTAVDYADPAATYEVRATAEVDGTNVTLSNTAFVLAIEPVRSYA